MKNKTLQVRVDNDFLDKLEYLQRIYDINNSSKMIRFVIEKEFRKEQEDTLRRREKFDEH